MRVDLALFCEDVTFDSDGRPSILGIFNSLYTAEMPFTQPEMNLFLRFDPASNDTAGKYSFAIISDTPEGKEIARFGPATFPFPKDPPEDYLGGMWPVQFKDFVFSAYGKHHFRILCDGVQIASVPLFVKPESKSSSD